MLVVICNCKYVGAHTHAEIDVLSAGDVECDMQGRQGLFLPFALYEPGGHALQFVAAVAPMVPEVLPAGHVMHVVLDTAPEFVEYVPAGQLVHPG